MITYIGIERQTVKSVIASITLKARRTNPVDLAIVISCTNRGGDDEKYRIADFARLRRTRPGQQGYSSTNSLWGRGLHCEMRDGTGKEFPISFRFYKYLGTFFLISDASTACADIIAILMYMYIACGLCCNRNRNVRTPFRGVGITNGW